MSDTQTLDRTAQPAIAADFLRHVAGHLEHHPIPAHIVTATEMSEWVVAQLREKSAAIADSISIKQRLRDLASRATAGPWETAGEKLVTVTGDIGTVTRAEDRDYLTAVQPQVILRLLEHLEDRSIPAPNLDTLTDAAHRATAGTWWHGGIFLYAGDDAVGYLYLQPDVDYVMAAAPERVLALIQEARRA